MRAAGAGAATVAALVALYALAVVLYMVITGDYPGHLWTGLAEDSRVVDVALTAHETLTGERHG